MCASASTTNENTAFESKSEEECFNNYETFIDIYSSEAVKTIDLGVHKESVEDKEIEFLSELLERWINSRNGEEKLLMLVQEQIKFLEKYPECILGDEDLKDFENMLIESMPKLKGNQKTLNLFSMPHNLGLIKERESFHKYQFNMYSSFISTHLDSGNFGITRIIGTNNILGRFGYLDIYLERDLEGNLSRSGLPPGDIESGKKWLEEGKIRIYDGGILDSQGVMKETLYDIEPKTEQKKGILENIKDSLSIGPEELEEDNRMELIIFMSFVGASNLNWFMGSIYSPKIDWFDIKYSNKLITGNISGEIDGSTYECDVNVKLINADEISMVIPVVESKNMEIQITNQIDRILEVEYAGNFWEGIVCNEPVIIAPTIHGYAGSGKKENTYLMLPIVLFIQHIDSVFFDSH